MPRAKPKTPQIPAQADIPPGGSLASQAAAKPTPQTAKAKEEEFFIVKDETCSPSYPVREHELIIGPQGEIRAFAFNWASDRGELKVDRAAANKFLKHEGFIVRDGKGNIIERVPDQPDPHLKAKPFVLEVGHVVAKLDELTTEAILTRVHQQLGGEVYALASGRPKLIAFLVKKRKELDESMKAKKGQRDSSGQGGYTETEDDFTPPPFAESEMAVG